jgi:hypothetical protein
MLSGIRREKTAVGFDIGDYSTDPGNSWSRHCLKSSEIALLGNPRLIEYKVSHSGFEIPIDYRDRCQIETWYAQSR